VLHHRRRQFGAQIGSGANDLTAPSPIPGTLVATCNHYDD
jgi:hypothetical protein